MRDSLKGLADCVHCELGRLSKGLASVVLLPVSHGWYIKSSSLLVLNPCWLEEGVAPDSSPVAF